MSKEKPQWQDYHGLSKQEWESMCIRCGECCKIEQNPPKYCPQLFFDEKGLACCKDYKDRYGTILQPNNICAPLFPDTYRGANCPYNKILGKPPPFEAPPVIWWDYWKFMKEKEKNKV